jgi:SynChlorMet cassette protein ScmA
MKKNRKQTPKKAKYEPPRMISLDDSQVAMGAKCLSGESATNNCRSGTMASGGNCRIGSVAHANCINGASPYN